ncbi:glycosyltransferase family 2 protein [Lysinibacillus sp. LZ02]|uniref:glycosyltransferase family 2 protein n=1 Tax=Lysinibacillus sp. LZ02 TaxID=3420668 RepID=UPI003D36FCDB
MDISTVFIWLHEFFGYFIMFYMVLIIAIYSSMLIFAYMHMKKNLRLDKFVDNDKSLKMIYSKPVSIIVPAYNEELGVVNTVHSLLTLQYPQFEIIVVNDGSKDQTLQTVIDQFKMKPVLRTIKRELPTKEVRGVYESEIHPNIVLVDKINGGKADALNVGINISKYPYFCSIDGDSILASTSLLRVMQPIVSSNDDVIAAGGSVRIANGADVRMGTVVNSVVPSNPFVIMQIIEYLRAFYMGRIALSKFNLVLIISGAFSVFSKKWVVKAGGYSVNTIGEDMELVVKLHRYIMDNKLKKRIEFVPDPVCWTEAPDNMRDLRTQRRRWHQGLLGSLMLHKVMTFNPKYKQIGMISFPYFWLIEFFGPIIELSGYIYIIISFMVGNLYLDSAIILTTLFLIYSSFLSMFAILLEAWSINTYPRIRDSIKLIFFSLTETFWFRPLTILFRLEGIIYYIRGREDWGQLQRRGLSKEQKNTEKAASEKTF